MHPATDVLLVEHCFGRVRPAHALLAECWLSLCPRLRRLQHLSQAMAGAFFEEEAAASTAITVSDACVSRTLAALDSGDDSLPPQEPPVAPAFAPAPLVPFLAGYGNTLPWKKMGDIRLLGILPEEDGLQCRLVACPPGKHLLPHTHRGSEFALVLQGAFSDDQGTYRRGDMAYADGDINHSPKILGTEECICLVVQQGDIHFTGRFSSLLNVMYPILQRR